MTQKKVHDVWLGLGSNIEDRLTHMIGGIAYLLDHGIDMVRCSHVYETEPVGYANQADFYNMVIHVRSSLDPRELLHTCQRAEIEMKRTETFRWGPRTLDVDILYIDDLVVDLPELTVPHPRIGERDFVLVPLADVSSGAFHMEKAKKNADNEANPSVIRKVVSAETFMQRLDAFGRSASP